MTESMDMDTKMQKFDEESNRFWIFWRKRRISAPEM